MLIKVGSTAPRLGVVAKLTALLVRTFFLNHPLGGVQGSGPWCAYILHYWGTLW